MPKVKSIDLTTVYSTSIEPQRDSSQALKLVSESKGDEIRARRKQELHAKLHRKNRLENWSTNMLLRNTENKNVIDTRLLFGYDDLTAYKSQSGVHSSDLVSDVTST